MGRQGQKMCWGRRYFARHSVGISYTCEMAGLLLQRLQQRFSHGHTSDFPGHCVTHNKLENFPRMPSCPLLCFGQEAAVKLISKRYQALSLSGRPAQLCPFCPVFSESLDGTYMHVITCVQQREMRSDHMIDENVSTVV